MRFATVALSILALGIASASAQANAAAPAGLSPRSEVVESRDFARKMAVRSPKSHKHPSKDRLITNGMLTWYGGGQLNAPACGGKTPSRNSRVVAVKEGGQFKCGDTLHLHYKGKMVEASVVDYCGGCADNHVDLTQGTFEALADLDEGELHGAHIRIMG